MVKITKICGKDFLRILDFSEQELKYMLAIARKFKELKQTGQNHKYFPNKNNLPAWKFIFKHCFFYKYTNKCCYKHANAIEYYSKYSFI